MKILTIAVLGLGGIFSRYFVGLLAARLMPMHFPIGTFLINIVGSFLIGVVYVFGVEKAAMPSSMAVGLLVGFLGGFTTFSSFSLESVRLIEQAEYLLGGLYFIGSPIMGYLSALLGIVLARRF